MDTRSILVPIRHEWALKAPEPASVSGKGIERDARCDYPF
jgi:hypothetical protein